MRAERACPGGHVPSESVIRRIGFVKEWVLSSGPVKASGIDNHSADAGPMSAKPFGHRVNNDIRAVIEWFGEIGCGKSGIDDERNTVSLGNVADGIEVGDFERGVGNSLAEKGARVSVDGFSEVFRIVGIDQTDFNAKIGKDVVELGVAAAVEILCRDDIITSFRQSDDGVENGGSSRGVSQPGHLVRPLEQGNAFFENVGGWVLESGVDVAEFLQSEKIGRVLGAVEDV